MTFILVKEILEYTHRVIDRICSKNERVRQEISEYFYLENRKTKLSKVEILKRMKSNPSFRAALLTAYKSTPATPYDFYNDPVGEFVVTKLFDRATTESAKAFLEHVIAVVSYRINTVLTDNSIQFADFPKNRNGATLYSELIRLIGFVNNMVLSVA